MVWDVLTMDKALVVDDDTCLDVDDGHSIMNNSSTVLSQTAYANEGLHCQWWKHCTSGLNNTIHFSMKLTWDLMLNTFHFYGSDI
jgi:hypothetical protein